MPKLRRSKSELKKIILIFFSFLILTLIIFISFSDINPLESITENISQELGNSSSKTFNEIKTEIEDIPDSDLVKLMCRDLDTPSPQTYSLPENDYLTDESQGLKQSIGDKLTIFQQLKVSTKGIDDKSLTFCTNHQKNIYLIYPRDESSNKFRVVLTDQSLNIKSDSTFKSQSSIKNCSILKSLTVDNQLYLKCTGIDNSSQKFTENLLQVDLNQGKTKLLVKKVY